MSLPYEGTSRSRGPLPTGPARARRPSLGAALILLAGSTLSAVLLAAPPAERPGPPLFVPAVAPATERQPGPQVVRERFVRLDRAGMGASVKLNLFADVTVQARHERTDVSGENARVWIGRTVRGAGRVFLSTVDDVTVGNIRVDGKQYSIRYAGDGVHVISEVDASQFPPERCDEGPEGFGLPPASFEGVEAIASDPCGVIDMMVLYTPAAQNAYGGAAAIEALIHLAISATNVSYEDSGVTTRISPVHIDFIQYVEAATAIGGDVFDDRDFMIDPIDGVLDGVPPLRDRYCADVVMLITNAGGKWCGGASIQKDAPNPAHEAKAYAVTVASCAVGNYTFAHELGHVQGALHDWYVSDSVNPFDHAHGYVNRPDRWRTIMAYERECTDAFTSCDRLGVWSNPSILIDGDPAGVPIGTSIACVKDDLNHPACDAENWQTLNATDCTVANFRDRSQCIDSLARNVWMKDTWDDTGLQPDPWTTGQDMWKSPYIWVRHDPDLTGAQQHIHENPEFGSINHVYVKLHNDFDVLASGRLKLYYAEAATGLSWPGDWTQFADVAVNNVAAHGTLINSATWSPPGSGHFCLLARWDSPTNPNDPMAVAEGSSVKTNTRNNNNIVWRNVNVVNLEPDLAAPVPSAIVRNIERQDLSIDLAVELPDTPGNFLRAGGRVLIQLGGLLDNWQSTGARGDGAQLILDPVFGMVAEISDTLSGTATLLNIPMLSLEEEAVNLVLTPPFVPPAPPFPPIDDDPPEPVPPVADGDPVPQPPVGTFGLDLVQIHGTERVGGVGYLIHVETSGGAGAVPDGATVPGPQLGVSRTLGQLTLDWGASCSPTDIDYAVYEGTLGAGSFTSHVPALCSTGGLTTAVIPEPAGDSYYLVVPTEGLTDGSYGKNGNGVERPGSLAACRPHAVVTCP